jgi:triphosphatase
MSEFELKFQVPPAARPRIKAALKRMGGRGAAPLRLQATYYDTADAALARQAVALRVRREGDAWVQTLKAQQPDTLARAEDNVVVPAGGQGDTAPMVDVQLHHSNAAADLLHQVLAEHDDGILRARYTTDVIRTVCEVAMGQTRIEIACDEGKLTANGLEAPIWEVEFELKGGPAEGLFALADEWVARHGLWLDVVSKAQRGEQLARGQRFGEVVSAGDAALERGMDGATMLRRVLRSCLDHALPNLAALAHGSGEPEHVHQARVGLRRLRTALRELGGLAPGLVARLDASDAANEVATAFRDLGQTRDATVLYEAIGGQLAAAGAPLVSWPQAGSATQAPPPTPQQAASRPALQRALLEVLMLAELGEPAGSEPPPAKPRGQIERRLKRLHNAVCRDGEHFARLTAEEQHAVRKRLKRLRYLLEFVQGLYGRKAVRRYLAALRPAQDALGQQQDEALALERFQQAARQDARAWFAVGWLQARRDRAAREAQATLRRVAEADKPW